MRLNITKTDLKGMSSIVMELVGIAGIAGSVAYTHGQDLVYTFLVSGIIYSCGRALRQNVLEERLRQNTSERVLK